ncbi:MAG: large subunit ribosomal protein L4 [Candidatus Peregrinibacteria bacterium Gr01-1014_25]|nr:MAG: large subunit ribosomal protein L4 [Candidatus Peregrinibacteria bacterium Gr01-1014_25]
MRITFFTIDGKEAGERELPESLVGGKARMGLMHQAVVLQQSNRRQSPAHVKTRGEVRGSTRKLYPQKHTGRARRGAVRSPLLRGGGKTFGPRNDKNYIKRMPKAMRHAALRSCLAAQAAKGAFLGLETYSDAIKTKTLHTFLTKIPVELGRRILFVLPQADRPLQLSARNIPRVETVTAAYLNPEAVLLARHIIFVGNAIEEAEKMFGAKQREEKQPRASKKSSVPSVS